MKSQHKLEILAHDAPIVRKASTTTASGYTAINSGVSCPSCGGAEWAR